MADVIRWRRGTQAQWRAAAPVLLAGEPGYETDTGRHKIGDGSTTWTDLPYFLDEEALEVWFAEHQPVGGEPSPDGLVVNVRSPAHGATGDGVTDDTRAIQSAIDATAAGGVCYFPRGTYLVSSTEASILAGRSRVVLAGAGCATSVIRVAESSSAERVLNLSRRSDAEVRDLGFDATGSGTLSGVWASSTDVAQRNLRVTRCRFRSFMPGRSVTTSAAVYTWTTDGVHVEDNEFIDCGRAVTLDQPDGHASVQRNRISASSPDQMATGILVRRASGFSESAVVVAGNNVTGARLDPSGQGAEGHGIAVFRVQDVHVVDNHVEGNGRGILVSNQSFGAVVRGNTCVGNNDAGIRCEPEITLQDITAGSQGARRGVTVIGNVCRDNAAIGAPGGANSGIGIALSYAAGSTVSGNTVHDNTGDGIFCDSDRVSIVGNVVYNNFSGFTADPTTGRRGGIRVIVGTGCTIVGNQAFDNQASRTQHYGLSLSSAGVAHVVHGNNFSGNATGEIWGAEKIVEGFFGVQPVTRRPNPGTASGLNNTTVLNALVTSLRELGLVE